MKAFNLPQPCNILIICPEIFDRDALRREKKFQANRGSSRGGVCGVKPCCPFCKNNKEVGLKEFSGAKGDGSVRMVLKSDGSSWPLVTASWLCTSETCAGPPRKKRVTDSSDQATDHAFSTLTDVCWEMYPQSIRDKYKEYVGGLDIDASSTLASSELCHLIIAGSVVPSTIVKQMDTQYNNQARQLLKGYVAFIEREYNLKDGPKGLMTDYFRISGTNQSSEIWNDWPPLDLVDFKRYFKPPCEGTLNNLWKREYNLLKGYFRQDLLSRPAEKLIRYDGQYKVMMKTMDTEDCEASNKVLLIVFDLLGRILFWAFADEEDSKQWQRCLWFLVKRTMRLDPTGEKLKSVVAAYADVCCNDSSKDPTKHWITKLFPSMPRAPLKDAFHSQKKVTDSCNQMNPLYDSFCKRLSKGMLGYDATSLALGVDAFRKENSVQLPTEAVIQLMLRKAAYKKALINYIKPPMEVELAARELHEEFREEEKKKAAVALIEGCKYVKLFTPAVEGIKRGSEREIENFIFHANNHCYEDPFPPEAMFVNDQAHPPTKGKCHLMPLYCLRGTGPCESTNSFINRLAAEVKSMKAETAHARVDVFVTKFNLQKDLKFEHVTKQKARSIGWFIDKVIQSTGRRFFAECPFNDIDFPPPLTAGYDEPIGREFSTYSDWEKVQGEIEAGLAGTTIPCSTQQENAGESDAAVLEECAAEEDHHNQDQFPQTQELMTDLQASAAKAPAALFKKADFGYGTNWGRHLGGISRFTLANVQITTELEGEPLETFLTMISNALSTYGSGVAEAVLVQKIEMAWREYHVRLLPSNHFGLGGLLNKRSIVQELRKWGNFVVQNKMHVYGAKDPVITQRPAFWVPPNQANLAFVPLAPPRACLAPPMGPQRPAFWVPPNPSNLSFVPAAPPRACLAPPIGPRISSNKELAVTLSNVEQLSVAQLRKVLTVIQAPNRTNANKKQAISLIKAYFEASKAACIKVSNS